MNDDIKNLVGKYVIVVNNNNKIRFLVDTDITTGKTQWDTNMSNAKCYYDLSAADIKVNNLKYDVNRKINAEVRYVNKYLKLAYVRRK